ncbi:MAG: DUF805 domain-containing protein [Alistipes sp.]
MKWFLKCIRNYVTFSGRARRKEYWNFVLFTCVFMIIAQILDWAIFDAPAGGVFAMCLCLFLFLPSLAVQVRRLHDTGKSGFRLLWPILAYIVWIILLVITGAGSLAALLQSGGCFNMDLPVAFISILSIGMLGFFVWGILFLVWYCTNGDQGDNKYGSDPKEVVE